jgi:hypothetical protein
MAILANVQPGSGATELFAPVSRFIRTHNETLSVAMRVNNPDRSPLGIDG